MGIDSGLISGYANLVGGLRDESAARKQRMIGNVSGVVTGIGNIYRQRKAQDAIRSKLKEMGATDAEIAQAEAEGPQATVDLGKKKNAEMQAKKVFQALGYDPMLGMSAGSPSSAFFQPQTIPASVKAVVAGGNAPLPRIGEGDVAPREPGISIPSPSTVGGVPMPAGTGAPMPPPPAAAPAADPIDAFLRRASGVPGMDPETLGLAAKFLPPRPKQPDPRSPEEIDLDKARAEELRAAAEAHRRGPREGAAPNPDHAVLTATYAKSMGWPAEWVNGETTVGQARQIAADRGIGKPDKPDKQHPDVASYAKANGVPYFEGMTFNDVAAEYKRLHPEVKDTSLADLTKLLTIRLMQTQLGNTESRDFAGLREQLQALEKKAGDIRNAATHRSAFGNGIGPKALDEDVRMLKAVIETTPRQPELAPLPTRGDVGLPPPPGGESDGPTPEEVKALEAEGKRYDPATKTIVPIK